MCRAGGEGEEEDDDDGSASVLLKWLAVSINGKHILFSWIKTFSLAISS